MLTAWFSGGCSPNKKDLQPKKHYCIVSWNFTSTTNFFSTVNHNYWISLSTSLCFKLSFIAMQSKCQTQYMQKLDYDISEVTISGAISSEFTKCHCQYIMHFSARLWVRTINREGQIRGQGRVDFSSAKTNTSVGLGPDARLSQSAVWRWGRSVSPWW